MRLTLTGKQLCFPEDSQAHPNSAVFINEIKHFMHHELLGKSCLKEPGHRSTHTNTFTPPWPKASAGGECKIRLEGAFAMYFPSLKLLKLQGLQRHLFLVSLVILSGFLFHQFG